jgi:predicted HTH transcriptional regulator
MFTPLARTTDPETSHDAARRITAELPELQAIVLKALRVYGPCTDRSLVTALRGQYGRTESTWRTRRAELVEKGLVEKVGKSHGQSVWKVKDDPV